MAKDFFTGMEDRYAVPPDERAAENIKAASVSERDPQIEGSIRDTSKELGYEAATLRGQSKLAIERAKQQKRIDGLKSKKETADWLAESPDNALLSMDDIDQVDRLIRVAKSIPMGSEEEQLSFGERVGASVGDVGEGIVNGVGGLMSSIYGGMRFVLEGDAKIARTVGLDGLAEYLESGVGFTERGADMAKELAPTLAANAFGGSVEDFDTANRISNRMNRARFDIYGISTGDIAGAGVSLVPTMLGGLAVQGLSTANKFRAFGAIAGTQQASSEFARQRGEGKEFGEAAQISAMSGLITGLLTSVIAAGPENVLDDLAKKLATANSPKELLRANLVRATSVQFASEFLEEGLDETLQALLVDGASWEEAIDRGLKAGAIGGILGGGIGLSTEIFAARQQSARTALGFRDGLESVAAELDQSLTAGRSSDAAKELMQSHGGLNKTAYLDGLAAQEIAKTKEGQETLYKAGITASDISTAVNGNDVIEVDTATVMAVSKGGVRSSILDNLRQEPDAPNSIEAELQTGESNIAARLAQQDETHELRNATAINAEATRLRDEIIKTSGVSKEQAAAQVEQLVTSARTMFNRNPDAFRSPEELLGRIRVQSGEDVPRGTLKQSVIAPIASTEIGDTFNSRQEFYQATYDGAQGDASLLSEDGQATAEYMQSQANNARGSLQITDDAYIISLFKGQDLSTVLHETGHIFLEEIRQAISTGNASDQLMKDWIATVRWQSKNKDMHLKYLREELRKSKRSDDATRTDRLTQTIEWLKDASESELQVHASTFAHELPEAVGYGYAESMHELWARGYESYLSEGKAPSLGLEKAFSRFSQWIAGVYSKVKNSFNAEHDLDVILNDEVRQVFDRILATDTEIKELMLFNQYTNRGEAELGDIAGFNPESTGKINSLFRESQNEIRNAMLKGRAKVAKERKKEFRSGVSELPVYQAWEQIKQQGGLRLVTVRTEFGQDTVNALRKKGLMAKGEESGASADAVATRNGYETAEDMILELMDAKPAAEQAQLELERAVLDDEISVPTMEHVLDSPSYDKAINELALGLDRALRGGVPIEERRILKQIAEREIADMPVYNAVQVNTYLGAMHRHFKDNRVQLTKNQYPEAMKSLQDGIKNMEKGRASRNARDMQNKLIKRIARWKKMDPKSVDYNYYYHAIKLAEFYGLSKESDIPDPDLSLKATLEEGINAGLVDPTPDYDEWMMFPQGSKRLSELQLSLNAQKPTIPNKRGPRQIFQVMQAKELEQIDEFLGMLIQRGRNKAEPTLATTGESVEGWYEDFKSTAGELDNNGVPRFDKDSFAQKISNIYNEVLDSAATPDHYYRTLDGQAGQFKDFDITKPLARLAMRGSAEAINKQEALKERVYAELKPHFQVIGAGLKRLRAEHGNSVTIEGVPVPQKAKDAGVKTWRPDRLLEVVFNLGNDYNADATASGFGWVQTKVNEDGSTEIVPDRAPMMKMAALFTKAELRAVQAVWDGLNTLWPESRRVHMQLYGKPPTKVDGDPIELQAADGPIKLAGGYFMLSFDKDDVSSNQMAQDSIQNLGMNYQDTFAPSKMTLSALKGRTHSGDKLINLNPLEVINKHIHSTTSFIALAPWLEDMKKVLLYKESASAPNVQNIMRAKIGTSAVKQLMTNMRALAGNEKFDLTWFGKAVQWTRPAVAVSLLGANIRGPVAVMDAIPTLMNDVGPVEYMREVNLFKQEEGVAMYNFILDKSQFMRRRLKGAYDRDVREVFNKEIGFSKLSGFNQVRDKIAETSLALYSYPAMAYEMPAWSAVFKKTLEQTGDEDASITAADLAIRSTQPSSDLRDQSMILRNKTGVIAAMTMFTGWAITRLSSNRFALRAVKAKKMSKLRWGTFFFFQNILSAGPFIMLAALSEAFDDDDRRKKKDDTTMFERMAKAGVVDYFHGIPLVSNVVEASYESLIEGKRFDISGVSDAKALGVMARIVGDGMNGMYDAFSEEDPDKRQAAMWDVAHLISFSLKIPVTRVMEKMTEQLERLDK